MKSLLPSLCVLFVTLSSASSAFAISETQYHDVYETQVIPWAKQAPVWTFNGKDGIKIAYVCYHKPGANDVIVVSSGRTESIPKYFELAYDIFHSELQTSICLMDHRGQGLSQRLISDPRKGHVNHFDHYADDLATMVKKTQSFGYTNTYIWSHSMGGAAAVRMDQNYPNLISGLILTAPMLGVNTSPYPNAVAHTLAGNMVLFFMGEDFIPGKTYYEPTGDDDAFNDNHVTRSKARWLMAENQFLLHNDEWPQAPLGGGTAKWLLEAIEGTWKIDYNAASLSAPTLLLQAGKEAYVKPESQTTVCQKAQNCQIYSFEQDQYRDRDGELPRHELLMETDDVRDEVLLRGFEFLKDLGVPTVPASDGGVGDSVELTHRTDPLDPADSGNNWLLKDRDFLGGGGCSGLPGAGPKAEWFFPGMVFLGSWWRRRRLPVS